MITRRDLIRSGAVASSTALLGPWSKYFSCSCGHKPPIQTRVHNYSATISRPGMDRPGIHTRAGVLLTQLAMGLDYFGQPFNFAPVLSADTLHDLVSEIAEGGKSTANALDGFQQNQNDITKQRDVLSLGISQATQQSSQLQKEVEAIPGLQKDINSKITDLTSDQERARVDSLNAANALNSSLRGCPAADLLTAASMVITVATGAPPILTTIVGAATAAANGTAFGPPNADASKASSVFGQDFDTKVKDVLILSGEFNQAQQLYDKAKRVFSPDHKSVDATKFLVQDGDFAKLRSTVEADVRNLPESSEKHVYVEAIKRYLSITQTRNQLLLSYDGLSYRLANSQNQLSSLKSSLEKANDDMTNLVQNEDAVQQRIKLGSDLKEQLMRNAHQYLVQYAQAVSYSTLDPVGSPPKFDNFEGIIGQIAAIKTSYVSSNGQKGNPKGKLTSYIKINLTTNQVQELTNTGKMSFQLSIVDPQLRTGGKPVLAEVYIDSIEVGFFANSLIGLRRIQDYPFILEHSGHHRFRTKRGKILDFVSPIRAVSSGNSGLVPNFTNASDRAPSEFVGVSPFTTWTVRMSNPPEEFRHLKQLQVSFSGWAYPIDENGSKMWRTTVKG